MQSLTIPDTFRNPNGYTPDEILQALQGVTGSRKLSFRYELLDENNKVKRELDTVTSATIHQDWLADIKRTAQFSLRSGFQDPIDYLKDRIKPWVRLHMPPKAIATPPAALPPDPPSPPAFAALTDDFESAMMGPNWASYTNGVTNVGGRLRLPATTPVPAAVSNETWILTGSYVAAELVRVAQDGTIGDLVTSRMIIPSDTAGTDLTIRHRKAGSSTENRLEFASNVGSTDGSEVSIPYDADEHRWVRIRESAGTVYFETSRTGFPGTWQIQRSLATPAWVTSHSPHNLEFRSTGDVNPDDYYEWDNLNLTPEGVDTPFMPQTVWTNNFNGTPGVTGEAITTNNSARHGNALDEVVGVAVYDDTHTADGGKAAMLGDITGSSDGVLVARLRTELAEWSMRFYYWVQTDGFLTVQPDGALINPASDMVFDNSTNTVTLGTVSVPSALRPNFFNQLVKVEVVTTLSLTTYRVYWTDPAGSSPDYVTSESNVGRDPMLTVTMVGGGSLTPRTWFDNLLITQPRVYQRFTDDSVNFVEWPQGVFLLSSPKRESDAADVISRDIDGYDLAQILQDDQVPDRFSTANLLRVNDNFSRDVTGSWGTSADGTVWLHNSVANTTRGVVSSSPGYAFIRIQDDSSQIRLSQAGNTTQEILVDSEIYCRVGVSQLSTGNAFIGAAVFRLFSSNDYYRVRIHFNTTASGFDVHLNVASTNAGTVHTYGDIVNTGLTYSAGEYFNFRAQCIGHVMRAKLWKNGVSEPAGWMIEEEVDEQYRITYGYTGVAGSNFTGTTNVNQEVRFDLFQLNPNPANTYTGVVEHLLVESNLPRKITANSATIPVPKEWEAGTSKRQIISDLLSAINYESLSFDEDGFAVVKPYVSPQDRGAEYTYQDNELSVMYPEVMQEYDLFSVPNRWIMTLSDPDRETITVDFTNSDPASPTSTVRRGRTITSFEQGQDADSEATMISRVARLAFESSQVYEAIEFSTALMPIHSGNDVLALIYDPLGINGQYAEVSWDMELQAGAKMTHRARRVISLVAATDPGIIADDVVVTGALDAGNIAAGVTSLTPVANKPTKVVVSGLNLQGTGPVRVIATAETSVPGSTFREVTTADHTPYGFSIWGYRTNTTATNIHWLALRGA